MAKIKIITDSACDIDLSIAEKNDVTILPFTITADGKEYKESYDFTKYDFYKMLPTFNDFPTTSQITPYVFLDVMKREHKNGVEDLIIFTINKSASATFLSAIGAKKQFFIENPSARDEMNIHIVDTNTYSDGYGFPILRAAEMIKAGEGLSEILSYLEDWFSRFELYFTVFDLKYAKKSGRIGTAAAIAGELLGIKPIISLTAGPSKTYSKVRGQAKALEGLLNIAAERMTNEKKYIILTANNENDEAEFEKMVIKEFKLKPMAKSKIGTAVAVNTGLEIVGIGFLGEKREVEQVIF